MDIRNIKHKGLRNYLEKGQTRRLPSQHLDKITDIVTFILDMDSPDEVLDLPKYKPHFLTGDRAGTISLSVTANWRITFCYDEEEDEIYDLDFEDYH